MHSGQVVARGVVSLACAFLVACGQSPHGPQEKYFFLVSNSKSPFWEQVSKGLNQAAHDLNVTVSFTGPDTYNPEGEKAEFKRIAALKPAGILVSVGDPKLLAEEINAAVAAGIPVIAVDSDAIESKRLFFVGTNNYEAGQIGGRAAAKALNGKGNVVAFRFEGQTNMEERLNGYKSVFAQYPQIKLIEVIDIKGNPVIAFDKTKEFLEKKKPEIDAFISMDGESAKEVAEVLKRENAKKVVIATDTLAPTLEGIESGWITATVAQKPYTMGYTSLRLIADLNLNKLPSLDMDFAGNPHSPLPRFVDTGVTLIDKSNLAAYRESNSAAAH
ncbi:MAG TPA: substrate-binding domain-containing protein [Bryobacteraceae bacterium]|nr:substrate-binding domain-containing protein [Bryobacteraceae bacterium]